MTTRALKAKGQRAGRGSILALVALLLTFAALLWIGCGGGEKTTLTVSKANDATPTGTLQQLWSWLRVGNIPAAATLYDRSIGEEIGPRAVTGALRQQAETLRQQTPEIVSAQRTRAGTLLTVRRANQATEVFGSYLLRRTATGTGWVIRYDSFLGEGIQIYARTRAQSRIDPKVEEPSPEAVAAGTKAINRYDALFAPGSKFASPEQAPATGGPGATTEGATTEGTAPPPE